jgi:hypothetical protein
MTPKSPERCTFAKLGGGIGGTLAGIPVGLLIGPEIAGMVAPGRANVLLYVNLTTAIVCGVIGAIGGFWLAYGTASACDDDGGGPGGPTTVSGAKAVVIWVDIYLAALLWWFGPYHSVDYRSVTTVVEFVPLPAFVPLPFLIWTLGISWQITAGRAAVRARSGFSESSLTAYS